MRRYPNAFDAEALIEGALEQAGDSGAVLSLQGEPATAATVFDGLAGFAGPAAQRHYATRFEVVAAPGDLLTAEAETGDVLLGRAFGEGGVAWADLVSAEDITEPEADHPASARRRRRYVRHLRIGQRLPHNAMIVRPRRRIPEPEQEQESMEFGEAVTAADIRFVQDGLNRLYRLSLATDGRIGRQTREAIKRFQRQHRLQADGIPGARTMAALRVALSSGRPAPATGGGPAVCTLTSPVIFDRFDFDKDRVLPRHQPLLRKLAECIVASLGTPAPINNIDAVGHTDPAGDERYNEGLGQRRAENLKTALLREIEKVRAGASTGIVINSSSKGETQPKPGSGALSRRVEVILKAAAPAPTPKPTPVFVWPPFPLPPSEIERFNSALAKLEAKVKADNDPRKWRYECWFEKLKKSDADDRVIRWSKICPATSGAIGAAALVGSCDISVGGFPVKQDDIEKRIRSIPDVDTEGVKLGIIVHLKADIVVSEEMTSMPLENLRMLHDDVQAAVSNLDKWANNPMGGSSAMPVAYVSIKDWIGRRQRDPKSVYSCL
jgi:outer membrane protein OmpA-like peptidoglycan-associated protein